MIYRTGTLGTLEEQASVQRYTSLGVQSAGTILTGAASMSAWGLTAAAIPVIGVAVAAVTIGLSFLFGRKSGRQKVQATKDAEAVIGKAQENLRAYMAGPHTRSSQAQALENFKAVWSWLVSNDGCGNPDLGDAGRRCISERDRGGIYDMWKDNYDPIANDPYVIEDPVSDQLAQTFGLAPAQAPTLKWILAGAGVLAGVALLANSGE